MTLSELLAMVKLTASTAAALDRRISIAHLGALGLGMLRPAVAASVDEISSQAGAGESAERMVYVAVPLSVLASAVTPAAGARRRSHRRRWRYHFAGLSLAVHEQSLVARGGGVLHLRKAECDLLLAFLEQPGQVLARRALAARLRRPNRPMLSDRAVDSYVCRLRAHFRKAGGPELIASVRSLGYRFNSDELRT